MRLFGLLCFLFLSFAVFADDTLGIHEKDVARIVKTLAADDMKGRQAGTEGARKAAAFIKAEFEAAGLKPYGDDFLQSFTEKQSVPTERSLTLNGTKIDSKKVIISVEGLGGSLDSMDQVALVYVSEDEEEGFIDRGRLAFVSGRTPLFVIPTDDFDVFNSLQAQMSRPKIGVQANNRLRIIMVGSDLKNITDISAKATNTTKDIVLSNVVGMIPGADPTAGSIIFSGHYDHLGEITPVNGDSIANGADDDASGVTAVIALARYFSKLGPQKRTLVFAAFTAEEEGGYGARHMLTQINPDEVAGMVNIEMIGKPSRFGTGQAYITGFELSELPKIFQDGAKPPYGFHPDPYPEENLFYRSDNTAFARRGVPAHTISTSQMDKDIYYHTVDDEFETLDIKGMTEIIRSIALGSMPLVNGTATPSRINLPSRGRWAP